mmetsp:Transcript_3968/g.5056  ORF Transcript_3968/g.5056 Transcript_3968/m.5056 type:complete len:309 (+) Transcript_3968:179-1105(+)
MKLFASLGLFVFVSANAEAKNPFTFSCLTSTTFKDHTKKIEGTCDSGNTCMCSHFRLFDNSWNCVPGEVPCGNSPKIPRFPTSSFQASITGSVDDGSAVVNMTGQWIYDGANRRERLDSVVWERSPEPNRFFSARSIHMVTAGEMVFEVTGEAIDMRDAKCKGFPLSQEFTGTAAIGSINRFLPREDRLYSTHEDKYLGKEDLIGYHGSLQKTDVWGWTEHDSETGEEVGYHKVYVSSDDGWPIREVEVLYIEDSDPVIVTMEFVFDHRVSYVSGGWYLGTDDVENSIFDVPRDCMVPRPKRKPDGDL